MSRQSANEFTTVEVVNMVQRRRWPLAEKLRIAEESLLTDMSISFVARQHDVASHLPLEEAYARARRRLQLMPKW